MNKRERHDFRMSSKWKAHRAKVKAKAKGEDEITLEPLKRCWNCHHLDNRYHNYDNLQDLDRFAALNKETHEAVHWIYRYWRQQKTAFVLRLCHMLRRMARFSNDRLLLSEATAYRNRKTGNVYTVVSEGIDCTNSRDGTKVVVYTDGRLTFVREDSEFYEKFERVQV